MNYIYIIENTINGKFYIGRTNNHASRKRGHYSELRRGVHGNPRLQNAWNKYGESSFVFRVVDTAPAGEIEAKEAEWFAAFDENQDYLYNCHFKTIGGPCVSRPHSQEERNRMSEILRSRTRKYIFSILDEGYSSRCGLNVLARKHSVGGTTLLRYIPEWEILRSVEYTHPQTASTKERLVDLFAAYSTDGVDVMRRLSDFKVSVQAIKKYAGEFGINWNDLKLDQWKDESRAKAFAAYEYKAKTNCTVSEARRFSGATVTTYYKYLTEWKSETNAAMSSSERAEKVVEIVKAGINHMHGACKQWRIGRDTVKKYHPEMFA